MSELVVRKLLIDLNQPLPRHWNGGDVFSSALLNALSMSFPVGEQFFIDSVRAGHKALPEAEQARFSREVQGFIGQEATHRRLHGLFNDQLTQLGYVNHWEVRARVRLKRMEHLNCRHAVAATAATEHLTAILAEWLLSQPQMLAGAPPAPAHTVALACLRGKRTSLHRLRPVPGPGRRPGAAHALDASGDAVLPDRPAAPDQPQPVARRAAAALAHLEKWLALPVRPGWADQQQPGPLARLLQAGLSPLAAGRSALTRLAVLPRGRLHRRLAPPEPPAGAAALVSSSHERCQIPPGPAGADPPAACRPPVQTRTRRRPQADPHLGHLQLRAGPKTWSTFSRAASPVSSMPARATPAPPRWRTRSRCSRMAPPVPALPPAWPPSRRSSWACCALATMS